MARCSSCGEIKTRDAYSMCIVCLDLRWNSAVVDANVFIQEFQDTREFLGIDPAKLTGDLKVFCEDEEDPILCHYLILSSRSEVFCKMFQYPMSEQLTSCVFVKDTKKLIMQAVIKGKFQAENVRHRQKFSIEEPRLVLHLMIKMLTHWGSEFFCTLSIVEVFGEDAMKNLVEDWIALEEGENNPRTQGFRQFGLREVRIVHSLHCSSSEWKPSNLQNDYHFWEDRPKDLPTLVDEQDSSELVRACEGDTETETPSGVKGKSNMSSNVQQHQQTQEDESNVGVGFWDTYMRDARPDLIPSVLKELVERM